MAAVAVAVLLLGGCAGGAPPPRDFPSLGALVSRLKGRTPPPAFRGLVAFEVDFGPGGATGGFTGKAVLLWQAPSNLRIEHLSPLGTPLLVVAARGARLEVYAAEEGRFYFGRADAGTMARWLGIALNPRLLIEILRGGLPVLDSEASATGRLEWDGASGLLRLDLPPGAGLERRQRVWMDPKGWETRRVILGGEAAELEVRYGPFRRVGGGVLPEWVEVADSGRGARVRVRFPEGGGPVADGLPGELFELKPPPGARVVPLPQEG